MRRRLRPGKGLSLSATHPLSRSSPGAERALLRAGRLRPPAVNIRTREALQASAEEGPLVFRGPEKLSKQARKKARLRGRVSIYGPEKPQQWARFAR